MKYTKTLLLTLSLSLAGAPLLHTSLLGGEVSEEEFPGEDVSEIEANYFRGKKLYDQKRYKEAYPFLLKAAEGGHADAQMHLGKMFYNGWGVKHNHDTGRKWHEKAAAQGNEESKRKLKNMDHH